MKRILVQTVCETWHNGTKAIEILVSDLPQVVEIPKTVRPISPQPLKRLVVELAFPHAPKECTVLVCCVVGRAVFHYLFKCGVLCCIWTGICKALTSLFECMRRAEWGLYLSLAKWTVAL